MTLAEAEAKTIIRVKCGSEAFGINLDGEDGASDRDEMGVCIEDFSDSVGFTVFDQLIYRDAAIREGKHDAPSQPGDLDLTIYSLRKFLRLALIGNPNILTVLMTPQAQCLKIDARGTQLQELLPQIVSKKAGKAFIGYMRAQRERLLGTRGQKRCRRPDLEEQFGYDTKYAMHILRLGMQGMELLSGGRFSVPLDAWPRECLKQIRRGEWSFNNILVAIDDYDRHLRAAYDTTALPPEPNIKAVEEWMLQTYRETWRAREPAPSMNNLKGSLRTKP